MDVFPRRRGVDASAAVDYRRKLKEVEGEINEMAEFVEEAHSSSLSPETIERLEELKDEAILLKKQLKQYEIEKRQSEAPSDPRLAGDSNAVTKAIGAAIQEIATDDSALSRHLKSNLHRLNYMFCYDPGTEDIVEWSVSF